MMAFKMRDSVPSAGYSSVCNVLRLWRISLIPTYRVHRLYDTALYIDSRKPDHLIREAFAYSICADTPYFWGVLSDSGNHSLYSTVYLRILFTCTTGSIRWGGALLSCTCMYKLWFPGHLTPEHNSGCLHKYYKYIQSFRQMVDHVNIFAKLRHTEVRNALSVYGFRVVLNKSP